MDELDRLRAERFLTENPEWAQEIRRRAREVVEDEEVPPEEMQELIEELALVAVAGIFAPLRARAALQEAGGEAVAHDDVAQAATQRILQDLGEHFPRFPRPR